MSKQPVYVTLRLPRVGVYFKISMPKKKCVLLCLGINYSNIKYHMILGMLFESAKCVYNSADLSKQDCHMTVVPDLGL